MDLKEFQTRKNEVDSLRRKYDKAQASLERELEELLKEFGWSNLEKAKKGLRLIENELEIKEELLKTKYREFEEKWKDKLGDNDGRS